MQSDEEIIAEVASMMGFGFGKRTRRQPVAAAPHHRVRWTDSDNLNGQEALIADGPHAGLRIVVNQKGGDYRYPDVVDLSAYRFDPEAWSFSLSADRKGAA